MPIIGSTSLEYVYLMGQHRQVTAECANLKLLGVTAEKIISDGNIYVDAASVVKEIEAGGRIQKEARIINITEKEGILESDGKLTAERGVHFKYLNPSSADNITYKNVHVTVLKGYFETPSCSTDIYLINSHINKIKFLGDAGTVHLDPTSFVEEVVNGQIVRD